MSIQAKLINFFDAAVDYSDGEYVDNEQPLCDEHTVLLKTARQRCQQYGWPKKRAEAWRYDDCALLSDFAVQRPLQQQHDAWLLDQDLPTGPRLVWLDGVFCTDLSDVPVGVDVSDEIDWTVWEDFLSAWPKHEVFAAMGLCLQNNFSVVSLKAGTRIEKLPVYYLFTNTAKSAAVLNLSWRIHESVCCSLQEHLRVQNDESLLLLNRCYDVAQTAKFHRDILCQSACAYFALVHDWVRVKQAGEYSSMDWHGGKATVRLCQQVDLLAADAQARLHGLAHPEKSAFVQQLLSIRHLAAHTLSRQDFRSVMAYPGKYNFLGRVYVAKDAQCADAGQISRNLLLDDGGVVYAKPELEIYTDDVSCTHATTLGHVDADALRYLCSRGLNPVVALTVLKRGFCEQILSHFSSDVMRSYVQELL